VGITVGALLATGLAIAWAAAGPRARR
jgi:hypothetical protein